METVKNNKVYEVPTSPVSKPADVSDGVKELSHEAVLHPDIKGKQQAQGDRDYLNDKVYGVPTSQVSKPTEPTSAVKTMGNGFDGSTYGDLEDWIRERMYDLKGQMLSKEDLGRLRKRQAASKLVAGIGDMSRAIANMWYTSQYAPNAYQAGSGLSERMQARFDKDKAERDALNQEFMNYALMLGQMKDRQQDKAAKQAYNNMEVSIKMAQAEREAKIAEAKLKHQQDMSPYEIEEAKAKVKYWKRMAGDIADSKVKKNNRSGNGRAGEYPWYDKYGNLHYAHTLEAARQNGIVNGRWREVQSTDTTETNTYDHDGNYTGGREVNVSKWDKGYPVKVKNGAKDWRETALNRYPTVEVNQERKWDNTSKIKW